MAVWPGIQLRFELNRRLALQELFHPNMEEHQNAAALSKISPILRWWTQSQWLLAAENNAQEAPLADLAEDLDAQEETDEVDLTAALTAFGGSARSNSNNQPQRQSVGGRRYCLALRTPYRNTRWCSRSPLAAGFPSWPGPRPSPSPWPIKGRLSRCPGPRSEHRRRVCHTCEAHPRSPRVPLPSRCASCKRWMSPLWEAARAAAKHCQRPFPAAGGPTLTPTPAKPTLGKWTASLPRHQAQRPQRKAWLEGRGSPHSALPHCV
jgi:hypothetical protein